ncbi:helix-turn-helix domain-containing protein [Nocardia sp. NPDC059091]|uniref:helix-turn-helix domain-containing protein n=1 Tax=unclassified Nocardia TaxID=2637762 RepID=UPI00369DA829
MRRHPSTVRDLLKRCGGVRPAARHRNQLRLSLAEREEISRGLAAGDSLRGIARGSGRSPSTISREVAGHGGGRGAGDLQVAVSIPGRPNTPLHDDDRAALLARRPTWILCGISVLDCVMSYRPGVSSSLAVISSREPRPGSQSSAGPRPVGSC